MATITKGKTFTNGELVTPASIHQLVDAATISGIVNADISASAAIADTKLAQISTAGKVLPAAVAGTAVITTDSRLSDARTPTTHTHGNITNAGAIGATAYLPVVTGTNGQLTTINSGQSGQVLSSSGGSSAPFWANPVNSGSTVISPNNIANTVVQRDATGSFYANSVQAKSFNVENQSNEIMFAVSPTEIGVVYVGLPNVNTGTSFCDFYRNGNEVGKITTSGTTGVAYNTSSDHRLKTNLEPLSNAVARLLQIPVRRFNWLADPNGAKVDGFLAHEAQAIVPESVTGHKDEVDAEGNPVHQGIDQSKLVPLLVAAVQELAARVAALEAR